MTPVLRAVLAGQHPSGKNQIGLRVGALGSIHKYPKARFEAWRGSAYAQLDRQRGAWAKLTTPARVTVSYTKGDLLRRDVPGMEDALCHLLEWCPIHGKKKRPACPLPFVADDSLLDWWVWKPTLLSRDQPRLVLTVEPYDLSELENG